MKEFTFTFPCSIGDKVWCVVPHMNEVRQEEIYRFVIEKDVVFAVTDRGVYLVKNEIYATRKEAEEALKRRMEQ